MWIRIRFMRIRIQLFSQYGSGSKLKNFTQIFLTSKFYFIYLFYIYLFIYYLFYY